MIKLSKRLQKIADLVDMDSTVIDVGTDHGYVPNFLCSKGISKDIYATDISKNSLDKSIELTKELGNEKYIKNILANGILNEMRDNIIIAGLGGIQIAEIIFDAEDVCRNAKKLILQPMQKTFILRRELMDRGYEIFDEYIVFEDDRFFEILLVRFLGEKIEYTNKDIFISNILVKKKDEVYLECLKERKEILEDILNNFNSQNERAMERKSELEENLRYLSEAIDEISN
ncbi:tRNA (adenine(22)-N(1))-methyltransferase [Peptoniphilus sp.]|jgi:tRNA (adenine22-N1)-methyltransferase|uniref:tRNA (adenine(22)-N(1))-methyltransferase n=1 Tax=Peptoniphilus sp. TaxID=1971214 RepID=UPI003D8BAF65